MEERIACVASCSGGGACLQRRRACCAEEVRGAKAAELAAITQRRRALAELRPGSVARGRDAVQMAIEDDRGAAVHRERNGKFCGGGLGFFDVLNADTSKFLIGAKRGSLAKPESSLQEKGLNLREKMRDLLFAARAMAAAWRSLARRPAVQMRGCCR